MDHQNPSLGGVKSGGKVVVGPSSAGLPPDHVVAELKGVHEICGMGTLILDEKGDPKLHMHAAFGRGGTATVGCIRLGVEVWQVGEVVVLEIEGSSAKRRKDKKTGFNLLETQ
ncbi:MAG: DUF296 domain-containing protein [Candidatus Bathyarchaeia archaeon]